MCHLLLLAPLFGLGLFVWLPLGWALLGYAVILVMSAALYRAIHRAHCRPVCTGAGHVLGSRATIETVGGDWFVVRAGGELWTAAPVDERGRWRRIERDDPAAGDTVEVTGVRGTHLVVRPLGRTPLVRPRTACPSGARPPVARTPV